MMRVMTALDGFGRLPGVEFGLRCDFAGANACRRLPTPPINMTQITADPLATDSTPTSEKKKRHREMREPSTRKIYDVQSFFYDATFGRLVKKRIERAIERMPIEKDDLVLDVGIGTGASLRYYPQDRGTIVGFDLSGGMLREAKKKVAGQGRTNAVIAQANALQIPFADASFDHIFISHVITVVSDPILLVREAQRVAKPDAKITIVNHFRSTNKFVGWLEKALCPICTKVGWKSDLALADITDNVEVDVDYRYKLRTLDLWETVVLTPTAA
jgi:phosphatidylethanolamine/phosphatidyl-N-methylethanolamine N-methyltransferase